MPRLRRPDDRAALDLPAALVPGVIAPAPPAPVSDSYLKSSWEVSADPWRWTAAGASRPRAVGAPSPAAATPPSRRIAAGDCRQRHSGCELELLNLLSNKFLTCFTESDAVSRASAKERDDRRHRGLSRSDDAAKRVAPAAGVETSNWYTPHISRDGRCRRSER